MDDLEAALARLTANGTLTAAQAKAVKQELLKVPSKPAKTGWLTEVAGYAGAALMIAGAFFFLSSTWDALSKPLRVTLLAGIAAILVTAAVLISLDPGIRRVTGFRGRGASALLALAPLPLAFAAGTWANQGGSQSSGAPATWAFTAGLVAAIATLFVRMNILGVVVAAGMTIAASIASSEEVFHFKQQGTGIVLLAAGIIWLGATLTKWIKPTGLGLTASAIMVIVGAQIPISDDDLHAWAYTTTMIAAIAFFLLYRATREIVTIVAGIIAVTLAVPEAVFDWTDGEVGPAVILLIAGIVLVVASAFGMQLRKSTKDSPDTESSTPNSATP